MTVSEMEPIVITGSGGGTPAVHAPTHASGGSDPITLAQSQVTGLTAALAGKATDTAVVHLTGTESVGGAKTFTATLQAQSYLILGNTTFAALQMFRMAGTHPGTLATMQGFAVVPAAPGTTLTKYSCGYYQVRTTAETFTMAAAVGLEIDTPQLGAGSAIAAAYGLQILPQTTATTTNVGIAVGASPTAALWLSNNAASTTVAGGIAFSSARDTNLYRSNTATLKTDGKLITATGLGVGNAVAATTPGAVVRKMEVFDAAGTSLGFVPIYSTIT